MAVSVRNVRGVCRHQVRVHWGELGVARGLGAGAERLVCCAGGEAVLLLVRPVVVVALALRLVLPDEPVVCTVGADGAGARIEAVGLHDCALFRKRAVPHSLPLRVHGAELLVKVEGLVEAGETGRAARRRARCRVVARD